jgi:glycopeptide antibiotics resistance protein
LILTKNEEQDLPGCLESVSWCDDIHVFDSCSNDNTVSIALNASAKVTQRQFDNWAAHQNWALNNIPFKYDWVFYLDADERVSPGLTETLLKFDPDNDDAVAYEIQRRDFAWNGAWLKHSQISPFYLRLFKPGKMRYERLVNPISIPDGPVKRLPGYLDHYPFSKGFRAWWTRHLSYADMEASMRLNDQDNKRSFSVKKAIGSRDFTERRYHQKGLFYKMPGRPFIKWLYMIIGRRAFMDGMAGITYATLQAIYEYFIVLKTKELIAKNGYGRSQGKKQPPENRFANFVYTSLGIFYSGCLVYIFFFARRRWIPFPKRSFNLIPFRDKLHYLQSYASHSSPENLEFYKDLIGNILLFIPFPFLLFYVLGIKNYRILLLLSMGTSLFIEIIQYVFNIGVADIDDLILNSAGASIGLLIIYEVSRLGISQYRQSKKWRTVR